MALIMDSMMQDMSKDRQEYAKGQLYDIKTNVENLNNNMDKRVKKSVDFLDAIDE